MLSPKKEIIDHFDSLIHRIDIDIDESLEKYNQEQVLSELKCFDIGRRDFRGQMAIYLNGLSEEDIRYETIDEWPESTKVVDYLNRIRMRTIEELRKAQEETLEYYKLNSAQFKLNSVDEIRRELFKDKFHFQVIYKPEDSEFSEPWIFNLFTFVTDFYISSTHINLLEKLINFSQHKDFDSKLVLDEKMVFIALLQRHFFYNLKTQKFPSHVIIVRKEYLLNVKEITCCYLKELNLSASKTIELSNIETLNLFGLNGINPEEIEIEGFSSLDFLSLRFQSLNQIILTNLMELRRLELHLLTAINSEILFKLIVYFPYIEILYLNGNLSYLNLNNLSNLKRLRLNGTIMDDFNFDLFDNLCNQLEYIDIFCTNFDDKFMEKLFYGRNFPYLSTLYIVDSLANFKLEKKLIDGVRMLQKLMIFQNQNLLIIDNDVFSNLIELQELHLSDTCIKFIDKSLFSNLINLKKLTLSRNEIESIEENCFSNLHNLEYLDLSSNQLTSLNDKSFVGLDNLKELNLRDNKLVNFDFDIFDNIGKIEKIYLRGNPIINKDEILKRSRQSNIIVYFY